MRAAQEPKTRTSGADRKSSLASVSSKYGLFIAWAAVVAVFGILVGDLFLQPRNFQTIFSERSILLILTLGMLPALAAGEYDLSVASTMGISFVLVGWLNIVHDWPILPTIGVALSAALAVGLVNAFIIVVLDVASIVTTLGMSTLLAGSALGINNLIVTGVSDGLVSAARVKFLGLQAVFYYALLLTVALWYVFSLTPLGRYIYFVGAGREVARLTGIRVNAVRAGTLIAGSVIAGMAGVLLAGRNGSVDPTFAPGLLLPAFAGAFLGATTITPGRFNPWGTFIAVYFLATGINGLQLLRITGWVEQVFFGAALIIGVVFSRVAGRRSAATTR